jgi:2-hydroxycyclohexanecarboxyl-CoA dehydrogenase
MQARIARASLLPRVATPEDVTGAVVFLGSDAAGFVAGQTVSVSGGYTMMVVADVRRRFRPDLART